MVVLEDFSYSMHVKEIDLLLCSDICACKSEVPQLDIAIQR